MRLLRTTAVVFVLLLSVTAFADQVTFNTATTLGCFTTGSSCSATSPATWDPTGSGNTVTFTGIDTSNATTVGGALAIQLGTFGWLGSASGIGSSENFIATVVFSLPTGINGGQNALFSADITGTVNAFTPDTINFNFANNSGNPLSFTFNNGNGTGSFQFYVDDVTLNATACGFGGWSDCAANNVTWNGHIVGANDPPPSQTPEPGSMVLLGSGLLSLAGGLRRKLRR